MSVLDQICADKIEHIRVMKTQRPLLDLKEEMQNQTPTRGFKRGISKHSAEGSPTLIAEVKKASPSKGLIRDNFNPVEIAKIYEESGAACISILTDEPYFKGKDEYLIQVRDVVNTPLLRKDFMLDPYQIYESRALGADCILLIMAALSDSQARELYDLADSLTMDVLVEIHDAKELERALDMGADMIGVNNRNLKTMEVTIKTSEELIKQIPENIIKISESGIHTHEQIQSLSRCGFNGFLVGESLMRQDDIGVAVQKLMNKQEK